MRFRPQGQVGSLIVARPFTYAKGQFQAALAAQVMLTDFYQRPSKNGGFEMVAVTFPRQMRKAEAPRICDAMPDGSRSLARPLITADVITGTRSPYCSR